MNEDLELRMIREIEKREARIEKREEELLENVMTLEEYFDEEFLKSTKFVEVGDKKLYRYFVDDIPLHEYPVCGVLKNNIDIATINFRTTKPFKSCKILLKDNEKVIKMIKKSYLVPSEMENIKIDKELLTNISSITVEVINE